jgi:hypothetical protein
MADAISHLENGDTMGERMGRIGQIETDFFLSKCTDFKQKIKKIRLNPPDPPHPFSHCIGIFQSGNCWREINCPITVPTNLIGWNRF